MRRHRRSASAVRSNATDAGSPICTTPSAARTHRSVRAASCRARARSCRPTSSRPHPCCRSGRGHVRSRVRARSHRAGMDVADCDSPAATRVLRPARARPRVQSGPAARCPR
eukprot:7384368-Prymnesium_polylepis.2